MVLIVIQIADSVFSKCNPCNFHYDAVIKMETFNADARFSVVRVITLEDDDHCSLD